MTTFFSHIPPVQFEGPDSTNPLAYRHYDAKQLVGGRAMADQLRWAVCYWHSFHWGGHDMFGHPAFDRPWQPGQPVTPERAALKMDAAFDFFSRLSAPFFTFHDADVMADYDDVAEYDLRFGQAVDDLAAHMGRSSTKLLWGTANLTGHPRYAAGAATNPDPAVFAWAAHQVRACMDATKALNGDNYVLWGGREGYDALLNTRLTQELDQLGRFLSMVVDHKHRIGFDGQILIEPKPHEPAKHMYDRDVATVYGFLKRYGLEGHVRVNIEANHATLAGNSFEHEIATALSLDLFGSIDLNRGDPQNGWDTDQFPNDLRELTTAMYLILKGGGIGVGGFNLDAKVRRQSVDAEDLFHAHIGAVDLLARALLAADGLIERGQIEAITADRYAGWEGTLGRRILQPDSTLASISDTVGSEKLAPVPVSGQQERVENLVSQAY